MKEIYIIMSLDIEKLTTSVLTAFKKFENAKKRCKEINRYYTMYNIKKHVWICIRLIEDD